MKSIFSIAKITIVEQIRNRLYLVILFFGAVIVFCSLLLGTVAPGHKTRVILDMGLLTIELFGLAAAVFGSVTLVLQEIESKTIYLLLTRPLPRAYYILGRYLGLVGAVAITMGIMALLHMLTMLVDYKAYREFSAGIVFWPPYFLLVGMSILKMLITCSLAVFFSLFATSAVSALTFTGFFWIAGHFWTEIKFLIDKSPSIVTKVIGSVIGFVIPNYHILNFRDAIGNSMMIDIGNIGWALLYGVGYSSLLLVLSSMMFSKKEF